MNVEVEILKGVSKGKRKSVNAIHAKALSAVGFLKIVEGSESSDAPEPARPRRTYRRKDMTAEA